MVNFTADLNDSNSQQFKSLASDVENALLPPLKRSLPGVVDVDVYGFRAGSVIAEYDVVMDPDVTVSTSQLQSAVTAVISNGNVTGLNVDTSFVPPVQGKKFVCDHTLYFHLLGF